ncbi:MAG: hypothetical protein JW838_12850 [Spirochaetes bacterium]|nr:hypothetical protein [Spirochaetota bacterium]
MISNHTVAPVHFLVGIIFLVALSATAVASGTTLIESFKAADETALQSLEQARRDHEYFSKLVVLSKKASANPVKHAPSLLRATLEGIRSSRLEKGLIPHLYDFLLVNDPGFRKWLDQQTIAVIATSSTDTENQAAQFRSDFTHGARNLGFSIAESPDGAAWKVEQEIKISDQGKIASSSLVSLRAGGHFTLRKPGNAERIARHQSEAGAHINPSAAASRAVKKLADSAISALVEVTLEEYAAQSR